MSHGSTLAATLAEKSKKRSSAKEKDGKSDFYLKLPGRLCVVLLIVVSPWLIGSVHYRSQFLLSVIGLVGLSCWWLENVFRREHRDLIPWVALPVILGLFLGVMQLLPLNNSLAGMVATKQREIKNQFGVAVENESSQPVPKASTTISLDPTGTKYQLSLLALGLAAMLLGHHYFGTKESTLFLSALIAGVASLVAIFGIVQSFFYEGKIYGFFEPEFGAGTPFGPFVNRNNAAGYLLIGLGFAIGYAYLVFNEARSGKPPRPIVSKEIPFWAQLKLRVFQFIASLTPARILALLMVNAIALGIIASLSRGGVLALFIGSLLTLFVFGIVRKPKSTFGLLIVSIVLVLGAASWLGVGDQLMSRVDQVEADLHRTGRINNWRDTLPAVSEFGVMGSGLGAYHAVHRLYRRDSEETLYTYAENQYFQSLVEGGFPALLLLLLALGLAFWCSRYLLGRGNSNATIATGLIGIFVLSAQSVASFFDFGLYISANMVLMAIAVGFICGQAHRLARRLKKKSVLRWTPPRWLSQVLVLVAVAATAMSVFYLHRLQRLDREIGPSPLTQSFASLTLPETEARIEKVETMVVETPTYWGFARLAELYQHRYRLKLLARMMETVTSADLQSEKQGQLKGKIWNDETPVSRLHQEVNRLRASRQKIQVQKVLADPLIQENLTKARLYLQRSREMMSLQPELHVQLAQLQILDGDPTADSAHLRRANEIAPNNPELRFFSGMLHLQAGRAGAAAEDWGRCIELKPRYYDAIIRQIHDKTNDSWLISPAEVVNTVIPNSPNLLYKFAKFHLKSDKYADVRRNAFVKASELLAEDPATTDFPNFDEIGGDLPRTRLERKGDRTVSVGKDTESQRYEMSV